MGKPKVYVTRQLFDEAIGILERHAEVEVFDGVDNAIPRDLLISKVANVDGLLPLLTDVIDTEVMDAAGEKLGFVLGPRGPDEELVGFAGQRPQAEQRHGHRACGHCGDEFTLA